MSHQSGIKVSEELSKAFASAVSEGNVRILRVSILNESLEPNGQTPVESTFEKDYEHVVSYLEDDKPSYILVRLDEKDEAGEYNWLFLSYVPDHAKIRDKMLYASTRATLTKELGDYRFTDNIYGTTKSEFTWDGYKKHLAHKNAEAPLTQRERELAEIKLAEAKAVSDYQGTTARKSYAPGIVFPLTEKAQEALKELVKSKQERTHNFVSLLLNKETIELDTAYNIEADNISSSIPADAPRFTFYVFEHEDKEAIVFIYTCPSSSKIRERMLYSSSKANVVTAAENDAGVKVTKKLETSDPSDLTKEYLVDEMYHPSSEQPVNDGGISLVGQRIQMLSGPSQGGFKRPVAPGRRRPPTTTAAAAASSEQ